MYYNAQTQKLFILTWQSPLMEYQIFGINDAAYLDSCGIQENKAMCHEIHSFGHRVTMPKCVRNQLIIHHRSHSLHCSHRLRPRLQSPPPEMPSKHAWASLAGS